MQTLKVKLDILGNMLIHSLSQGEERKNTDTLLCPSVKILRAGSSDRNKDWKRGDSQFGSVSCLINTL